MPTEVALAKAQSEGLNLVEVNPMSKPPVCKIMDYGRFKYEEKKRENEAKKRQIQVELKEVKLRPKTDDHDLDVKARHIRRFLEEGNKVKVTCRFRGREITHPETAERQLVHFIEVTRDIALIEQPPRMEAKTMTILLGPKPDVRAKAVKAVAERVEREKRGEIKPRDAEDGENESGDEDE